MAKTHSQKIREAVTDLGEASPNEIMNWIRNHYPNENVNPISYRADIIGSSKNHSSSHHYTMSKFLFFNSTTKKYRMIDSDEVDLTEKNIRNKKTDDGSQYVDGILISKLGVTGGIVIPTIIRDKMNFQLGDTLAFIINQVGILELRKAKIKLEFT